MGLISNTCVCVRVCMLVCLCLHVRTVRVSVFNIIINSHYIALLYFCVLCACK